MNVKRIASSIATLATVGSVLAGATFALFSDQATSADNTFSTGNASLLIAEDVEPGDPGTYSPSIGGMDFPNITPGFEESKLFWLKNDGTIALAVTAELTQDGALGNLEEELMVTLTCDTTGSDGIGAGDFTATKAVSAWYLDGSLPITTLAASTGVSDATTASDADELLCEMRAELADTFGNEVAGQSVKFDGMFGGTQL